MRAENLKTEYLKNPIGIDITEPRLFWNCSGGIEQTAYRILATDEDGNTLWDTKKVESHQMTHIKWQGKELHSRNRVYWQVMLWDENGKEGQWSDKAYFEVGLLEGFSKDAKWITGNYEIDREAQRKKEKIKKSFLLQGLNFLSELNTGDKSKKFPPDYFKKEFSTNKAIKKARAYISACGLYEAEINGKRVGDFVLAPGVTDYKKRIQYQSYDVTDLIAKGENIITACLADGWYRGSVGAWGIRNEYGFETKLIMQLELYFEDGTSETICTDSSWSWSNDGAIRFADNKDGEIVDANMEPSYSGSAKVTVCGGKLCASNNVSITEHERFKPQLIITPKGAKVLDFGQNFSGYIEFNINAPKNSKISIRFGELIDDNGEFTQKNIQCHNNGITTPLQEIKYTFKEGENHYKTRFAVFGFRYALVEGDVNINPSDFTGIAVYSDIEQTGFFNSSNDLLNKFYDATVWSAKSNNTDIPTDCPTRERHGWTGDAQIFFKTAAYMFDYAAFSKKYLRDVFDWQKENGNLPQIAPAGGVDFYMEIMNGSVGWADAGIIMPYQFYEQYGDTDILSELYDKMKNYAEFMISRIGKNALLSKRHSVKGRDRRFIVNAGQSYGEWAEPADVFPNVWTNMVLPHVEVSTAYTSYVLGLMSKIAQENNKLADSARYDYYSKNCKKAYQSLVETEEHSLDTNRQACLVRPLAFDLLNKKQEKFAKKRLIEALERYGWRVGTGFLSTPLILDVLSKIDTKYAYKLLENKEMPGWLFMTKMGATTIWESWEGTKAQNGIGSLNHYSKGAVCQWLFSSMCGINVDGQNHFKIAPLPGGSFAFAGAEYKSVFGTVKSSWKKEDEKIIYEIEIPSNCTAQVELPDGRSFNLKAGKYTY